MCPVFLRAWGWFGHHCWKYPILVLSTGAPRLPNQFSSHFYGKPSLIPATAELGLLHSLAAIIEHQLYVRYCVRGQACEITCHGFWL